MAPPSAMFADLKEHLLKFKEEISMKSATKKFGTS
jgi:hypothetical protein